ncbi:MAG: family 10 glycosylhydrolase [Gemmatimonadota bacterium]|nr:family 10 glycosylhydrolase [Gemmatimonadota bacterium]
MIAREFRAAWIASVNNIDWPSRPGLSTEVQQAELLGILDRAVQLNLNALILQVRPAADALYSSAIEPWSPYLTGTMGKAPDPFYDPLAFAVDEAHKRGLELHAWFNPFRAKHSAFRRELSPSHISQTRPDIVLRYGESLWMDPGEPDVHRRSLEVILDVVRRYDIDGVHIDDYFYPYQERDAANALIPFPDDASYRRYGAGTDRADWRRHNVDRFVADMFAGVRSVKPHVKVGISPFGIWRPGYPAGVTGFDAYASIYADARKWLNNGWLDYLSPQLYWRSDAPGQNYSALLRWWVDENTHRRHIWPGNFTSRTDTVVGPQSWRAGELLRQIMLTRADAGAGGNVHFSMRALMRNRDSLSSLLASGLYAEPALVPASPWLDSIAPVAPAVAVTKDDSSWDQVLHFRPGDAEHPWLWTVRVRSGAEWRTTIVPGTTQSFRWTTEAGEARPSDIWVTAVDRAGNESSPVLATVP